MLAGLQARMCQPRKVRGPGAGEETAVVLARVQVSHCYSQFFSFQISYLFSVLGICIVFDTYKVCFHHPC